MVVMNAASTENIAVIIFVMFYNYLYFVYKSMFSVVILNIKAKA